MAKLSENTTIGGKTIIDLIYPIGTIYETENSSFDPNTQWGGVWQRIKGKVLVGVDEDDSDFSTAGLELGEKTHTLTVSEMPSHGHSWSGVNDGTTVTGTSGLYPFRIYQDKSTNWGGTPSCINNTGGGSSHNNIQPSYTVYIWKRTS